MRLYFDFAAVLFIATIVSGGWWLIAAWIARKKAKANRSAPVLGKLGEYAKAFFPIFLIVFLLRGFFAEPYRIPSGSMKPTLLVGDFILVNKYSYGVRLPLTGTKLVNIGEPRRGDIIVFRFPEDTSINYIKRVVGMPGDKIKYVGKRLYVNGNLVDTELLGEDIDNGYSGKMLPVERRIERLETVDHEIFVRPGHGLEQKEILVPEDNYFVMGDNRDNSEDSRVWGFVPNSLLVGKAVRVLISWNELAPGLRWRRSGMSIK